MFYISEEDYHERQPTVATTTNQYFTIDNARKYTNYSVSVLAFTSLGDGMKTKSFHCITHEDGESKIEERKFVSFLLVSTLKAYKLQVISSQEQTGKYFWIKRSVKFDFFSLFFKEPEEKKNLENRKNSKNSDSGNKLNLVQTKSCKKLHKTKISQLSREIALDS